MKAWESRIVPGGFALAGLLFAVAAFKPSVKGLPMNATYFVLSAVFLLMAFITWRKIPRL